MTGELAASLGQTLGPTGVPYDLLLAHHPLVLALPFFVPALLVVLAVGAVVVRDRRQGPDDEGGAP